MLKYSLRNYENSSEKMPARNFYLVESDANLTRQENSAKYKEVDITDPGYEEFTNYIHYRKPLKNQWHMPRPNSNVSYNSHVSSGSSNSNPRSSASNTSSHERSRRENIYEQVIDVAKNREMGKTIISIMITEGVGKILENAF